MTSTDHPVPVEPYYEEDNQGYPRARSALGSSSSDAVKIADLTNRNNNRDRFGMPCKRKKR